MKHFIVVKSTSTHVDVYRIQYNTQCGAYVGEYYDEYVDRKEPPWFEGEPEEIRGYNVHTYPKRSGIPMDRDGYIFATKKRATEVAKELEKIYMLKELQWYPEWALEAFGAGFKAPKGWKPLP